MKRLGTRWKTSDRLISNLILSLQVVRAVPKSMVPLKAAYGPTAQSEESKFAERQLKEPDNVAGFLEVVHLADKKVTYIPVSVRRN